MYVSTDSAVNSRQRGFDEQIATADPQRIMSESDTGSHFAERTSEATARIAAVWGTDQATAASRLAENFFRFCKNERS